MTHRGIRLLCIISKAYESFIEKKLTDIIEPQLYWAQSEVKKGHSTQNHTFTLKQLTEKNKKN